MNADLNCLSLMELMDLRQGVGDADARAHLDACPRCRALLTMLPDELALPELAEELRQPVVAGQLRPATASVDVGTGALWRARGESGDYTWVVVVIGRAPDADDRVLVAPVVGEPQLATDYDLLLDASVLGYQAFADVGNVGVVLREQLVERIAELAEPSACVLVDLYRAILGGGQPPASETVGIPVLHEADPRLLAADERRQALRSLWRRADRLVDAEDPAVTEGDDEQSPAGENTPVGLATMLDDRLTGPEAEWDRATLLEESGADGARLDGFLGDHLDLTDKRDIGDLARVLHALEMPWEQIQPAVVTTLSRSAGGTRRAEGPTMPMAARAQPGVSDDEVTEALYADQSAVDRSAQARQAEITQYVAELRRALDDLG